VSVIQQGGIMDDGKVTGVIQNDSSSIIRNVRVLIRYPWMWHDEFDPGPDSENPGRAFFHTVGGKIAPGDSATFRFAPPSPLPQRDDGYFESELEIFSFTVLKEPT
jgi:hypothetical protein